LLQKLLYQLNRLLPQKKAREPQQIQEKLLTLDEAGEYVQKTFAQNEDETRNNIFNSATAGKPGAIKQAKNHIRDLLEEHLVTVEGYDLDAATEAIFRRYWGLGPLDELYHQPDIDEIRVLDDGRVFVTRRGKNEKTNITLKPQETEELIRRMIIHDTGVSLDESSPRLEAIREDGSRLTAMCRPVARDFCFALRKRDTVDMSVENLTRLGTLNEKVWKLLSLLVKGRCNILLCGGVGTGKTSLLRKLLGELNPKLAVRILDTDREIRIAEAYPDREILELEAHPEIGASTDKIFKSILRFTPDVIIVGEYRGYGEARQSIHACSRGHDGSMGTAHFPSPQEAVRGTAMLMLEEGLNLDLDTAQIRVAQAYNIVIQMFGDSVRGVKKVVSVTEIIENNGEIIYNDLIKWEPHGDDFLGSGEWKFIGKPSSKLIDKMKRHGVTETQIREVYNYG
jgi:pilus assembly protein CpaF